MQALLRRVSWQTLRRCGRYASRCCPTPRLHKFVFLRETLRIETNNKICSTQVTRFIFTSSPEWHNPSFMEGSSVEAKEAWLESLIQTDVSRVDASAYLVVLQALAQSDHGGAPQKAEIWIGQLEKSDSALSDAEVVVDCYNAVIQTWANSREAISPIRAERWLNKLRHSEELEPNTESFNAYLDALSNGGAGRRKKPSFLRELAMKAQLTLDYMVKQYTCGKSGQVIPNTESFNFVIRAWTRCSKEPDIANRVLELAKQMADFQRKDPANSPIAPDTRSFAMVMDAFANAAKLKAMKCMKSEWKDPTKNGMQEMKMVQSLLQYMMDLHKAGLQDVMPNTVSYNTLIKGWSGLSGPVHPSAPLQAEKVLRRMIALREEGHTEVAPDVLSYIKIMTAWISAGKDTSGERAEYWFRRLCDEYEFDRDERLKPTVHAYNILIKAWISVGRPDKAEDILEELVKKGEDSVQPNSESFATVIHGFLKSKGGPAPTDEGVRRAARWLDELILREKAGGVTTSPDLFISILRRASKCAYVGPDLLDLCIDIFDKYRASRHRVESAAYVTMLQTGLEALGLPQFNESRHAFIRQLVWDCCEDGLLSGTFLRALANSQVYYDGWTAGDCVRLVNKLFPHSDWPLPLEWSRNLPDGQHVPQRNDAVRTNTEVRVHGYQATRMQSRR